MARSGFYCYDQPVSGKIYTGRELLLRALISGVQNERHFALCGGPRCGRSSTLLTINESLRQLWVRRPQDAKLVPIILNLEESFCESPPVFCQKLWDIVLAGLSEPMVRGNAPALKPPKPVFAHADDPFTVFRNHCSELWQQLSGTSGWVQYILLVDNTDLLIGTRQKAVLRGLASLLQLKDAWAPTGSILAGGRALRDYLYGSYGHLGFLRTLFLGLLKESEAAPLVHAGLGKHAEHIYDSLWNTGGQHPYVLQRLLSELEKAGPQLDIRDAAFAARFQLEDLFDEIWEQFDLDRGITFSGPYAAPEHALMQLLLDYEEPLSIKTAEEQLGLKPLKEYAEFMEYVGVAERVLISDEAHYRAPFRLWNAWYLDKISMGD